MKVTFVSAVTHTFHVLRVWFGCWYFLVSFWFVVISFGFLGSLNWAFSPSGFLVKQLIALYKRETANFSYFAILVES